MLSSQAWGWCRNPGDCMPRTDCNGRQGCVHRASLCSKSLLHGPSRAWKWMCSAQGVLTASLWRLGWKWQWPNNGTLWHAIQSWLWRIWWDTGAHAATCPLETEAGRSRIQGRSGLQGGTLHSVNQPSHQQSKRKDWELALCFTLKFIINSFSMIWDKDLVLLLHYRSLAVPPLPWVHSAFTSLKVLFNMSQVRHAALLCPWTSIPWSCSTPSPSPIVISCPQLGPGSFTLSLLLFQEDLHSVGIWHPRCK